MREDAKSQGERSPLFIPASIRQRDDAANVPIANICEAMGHTMKCT